MWTFQKIADFEYLSVFQSFHSIPSFLLILRMEESKTWEAGPNLSSSSPDSSRNFRDAMMGSKKPDRAMDLLRAHVLSKFVIPPSDLSYADIVSRQGRAEADNLTAQERGFEDGLLQGVISLTQWSSAHLSLFTAAELRNLGDTRFRDSPNRFRDCIYLAELKKGDLTHCFPTKHLSCGILSCMHGAN